MGRTHTCGELRIENVGQTVTLVGWVHDLMVLGSVTYADLRDSSGITQLVVETRAADGLIDKADSVGGHWVQVTGEVVARNTRNPDMETGDIEVRVMEVKVIKISTISIKRLIWAYENCGLWRQTYQKRRFHKRRASPRNIQKLRRRYEHCQI